MGGMEIRRYEPGMSGTLARVYNEAVRAVPHCYPVRDGGAMLGWYVHQAPKGPSDRTEEDTQEFRRENREELHRQLSILLGQLA